MSDYLGKRLILGAVVIAFIIGWQQRTGSAQQSAVDVAQLEVPAGAAVDFPQRTGEIEVWITLVDPSVGEAAGPNAKRGGASLARQTYAGELRSKQDALVAQVAGLGGREVARVIKAHNAVAVRIDASRLQEIAALPGVRAVRPARNYRLDLSTTVPYIGASAVQGLGVDGSGVKVAVLDSGIDYTHRNLGGSGQVADYAAAFGTSPADPRNKTRDGLFPTAKVVDGFDFVGEGWPNTPLAQDDDPIDFDGHGTHVADIIAGRSLDNTHKGVAPGASLVALKVCSSVSTACSGVALLQAMDRALDPNGDDDLSDAVDVINMSLGSDYGQKEDDLNEASDIAARFGVVVVAAAGNAGNRPYIVSSPAVAPHVIGVAQTNVPTATAVPLVINAPTSIAGTYANTATLDFAPITGTTTGAVAVVGRGCPAGSISTGSPADAYLADPAGKVALIDRGSCNISVKIDRAANAGAIGVLIGLVAAGDAVSFAYGGGTSFVPSLVITLTTSNLIKANRTAPVNVTLSAANAIALAGGVTTSSARGPSHSYNAIKPDIGAPGASVSAVVGTGSGQEAFGGTSGATPMISGSAALLLQARPQLSSLEVKALLMNNAEINVFSNPQLLPGVLAPITRIGAGEVRVNRAVLGSTAVWNADDEAGSLSFGYVAAKGAVEINRRLLITNYSGKARNYSIGSNFRYANDAASGAVKISAPATVNVQAGGQRSFVVKMAIDPTKLPTWNLNGGSQGGNGSLLDVAEFDGYLTIADATDTVHMPWHVLPHKAAGVTPSADEVQLADDGTGSLLLSNDGAVNGRVEVFSLTGTSHKIQKHDLPNPGDSFAVIDLKAVGVRQAAGGAIQFGITTNGVRSHPNYPAEFDVYVDSNRDGVFDYVVFNIENGGFGATGQNVVAVANLTTNTALVRFFADADLDSSNFIATALLSDLGLTPSSQFDFSVLVGDNYFTGAYTDSIEGMTYTPGLPRFTASGVPASGVPAGGTSLLTIQEVPGGAQGSPSQTGLLLLYRDGVEKKEASVIKVE